MNMPLKNYKWITRHAHGDYKLNNYAKKLSKEDYEHMVPNETAPYFTEDNDSSNVIVFTSTGSYVNHVAKTLMKSVIVSKKRGKRTWEVEEHDPRSKRWGQDEAHIEYKSGAGALIRIRHRDTEMEEQPPQKFLLTGTPFETSPSHMAHWLD